MSFRTVVISKRCKLDLKMGYMVIRGEETRRVFLEEISVLLIENNAVSLTGCLLEALTERNIKVIFCDGKRNPMAELSPIYGSHDTSRKIREQILWTPEQKALIWTEIIAEKIRNQSGFLYEEGKLQAAELLESYISELEINDVTNREGHAAKVYFNAIFGMDFTRSFDCCINSALNYGYGILLSVFNRDVVASGYLTQIGLFHDNVFNKFNLSCDLMEPFRIAVDKCVYRNAFTKFEKDEKIELLSLLNSYVYIGGSEQTMLNAIRIYTKSVFSALEIGDISLIKFAKI